MFLRMGSSSSSSTEGAIATRVPITSPLDLFDGVQVKIFQRK